MYGTEVSPSLLSAVTDAVIEEVKLWGHSGAQCLSVVAEGGIAAPADEAPTAGQRGELLRVVPLQMQARQIEQPPAGNADLGLIFQLEAVWPLEG